MRTLNEASWVRGAGWAVCVAAAVMAGCKGPGGSQVNGESSGAARPERGGSADMPRPAPPRDSVGVSELRERALRFLGEASLSARPEIRANAIEALIPVPARLEVAVRRGLSDENLGVRGIAAAAVGRAKITRLAESTRPLLMDQSPLVRVNAIFALRACGQPVDIQPLGAAMQDSNPYVRAQAGWVLGELGDKAALPLLRETARDPMSMADTAAVRSMRLQLAEAMVKLGDQKAIDEVRAALYPSRPEELEATVLAAQVLGQVGDRQSVGSLIQLVLNRDAAGNQYPAEVRMAAAAALAKLGQPRGTYIADEYHNNPNPALRAQAAMTYGDIGLRENLGLLEQMMGDPDQLVGVAAAAGILRVTDGSRGGR